MLFGISFPQNKNLFLCLTVHNLAVFHYISSKKNKNFLCTGRKNRIFIYLCITIGKYRIKQKTKMRKTFHLLAAMMLCAASALAGEITEKQAYQIAGRFFNNAPAMRKAPATQGGDAITLAQAAEGYYAFNRGRSGGYVIVAADDRARAEVLGYADRGTFRPDSLPEAMRWWLGEYARELAYAAQSPADGAKQLKRQLPTYSAIEPMLSSQWGQDDPYNALCPTYQGDKCPTGCVATAVAQIMYYHKWPERGTGSHSYDWVVNDQVQNKFSVDFSESTYNWQAMTDTYGENSTQPSKDAVAKLMYDLGVATEMGYHPSGSGTQSTEAIKALANYFGYDPSVNVLWRDYYGLAEWQEMLYRSLAAGQPVYYAGSSYDGAHAFVFDGYRDGYFHINWGWDGMSNGYFIVSALDPTAQGTGGSSSGYNFNQNAAIAIRPAEAGSVATPLMYCANGFTTSTPIVSMNDYVTFTGGFYNYGCGNCNMTLGIKVVCPDGDSLYLASDYTAELSTNYGYSQFEMSLEGFPTESGSYLVYPAYRDENDGTWHDIPSNITYGMTHLIATVNYSMILFSSPDAPVENTEATGVSLLSTPYAAQNFQVKATITNNGSGEYIDEVFAAIVAVGGNEILANSNPIAVDIIGGDATDLTFTLPAPVATGNYELVIASLNANAILSERLPITVTEAPEGDPSFSMASPLTVSNAGNVTADNLQFTAAITCNSGFYGNQIFAYVFPEDGDDNVGYLTTDLYIGEGETRNVTLSGSIEGLEVGKTYITSLYYVYAGYYLQQISYNNNYAEFTVGALTPVDGISDDAQPHDISVYNLAGRCLLRQHATKADLSQLAPGTYIIKENGKTKKVVKN